MPDQAANASIVANSSVSAQAGLGQPITAGIGATSLVMANPNGQHHASAHFSGNASLTPNTTGNYKGTTAHVKAGALLSGFPTAHWRVQALAQANSTFTTWRIIQVHEPNVNIIGGSLLLPDVHVQLGAGPPTPLSRTGAAAIVAGPPGLSATASVHHRVQVGIIAGSSVSTTASINRAVSTLMVGGSLVLPPQTTAASIVAGSIVSAIASQGIRVSAAMFVGSSVVAFQHLNRGVNPQAEMIGGAGNVTGSPIRILLVAGVLRGAGTIDVPYVSASFILGNSNLSATPTVHRNAQANIAVGSTLTAGPTAQYASNAGIVAFSHVQAVATVRRFVQVSVVADSNLTASGGLNTYAIITAISHLSALVSVHHTAQVSIVAGSKLTPIAPTHIASSMVASSTFAAAVTIHAAAQAIITGIAADSSLVATAKVHHVVTATMAATSSVAAAAVLILPHSSAALIVANSSVTAIASVNRGILPLYPLAPIQTLILGAQMTGAGTLQDKLLITLSGILSGAGAIAATPFRIIAARPLPMVGSGGMNDSIPLPMVGFGTITGFFELQQLPRPFCPPRHDKVFRYGYILTRGDLELVICDASGNPFAPVVVLFSFYQIVAGGQRMLVGPPNRRPAVDNSQGKVGRYYATGTAGELGQPGEWVVVWRYQRSWWTPTITFEEHFKVVDEVTLGDPGAFFGRCCKYGWL